MKIYQLLKSLGDLLILYLFVKPYLVRKSISISHLKNIFTLGNCVGERLTLKVVRSYWSHKLIKIPSFCYKVSLWYFFTEKWPLKWIGASRIFSPFGGRRDLLHVRGCKGGCVSRRLIAWILWGNVLRNVTESGSGVRQISLYVVLGSLVSLLY